MKINRYLKDLLKELKNIFSYVFNELKNKEFNEKTLDTKVLNLLKEFKIKRKNLEINFLKPQDTIYKAEAGRSPYDILCAGIIEKRNFKIFINNKLGNLKSNTRNDTTTYNNLLRLYLNITSQRLDSKMTFDKKIIYKRISGKEIVSYGMFIIDRKKTDSNFFLLEEISGSFYVNPRNNMFQVSYNPILKDPINYYSFINLLIDSIIKSLEKSINSIKTEINVLKIIKNELITTNKT